MARLSGKITGAGVARAKIDGLSPGRCMTDMPEGQIPYMRSFLRRRSAFAFFYGCLYPLKC